MEFNLDTFSSDYFAPTLIILGLIGNLFGLIVITKKKLIKIGPQNIYISMFIFDWINFVLIFKPYLHYSFIDIDLTINSSLACKIYWYLSYSFGPISPMLNVYNSIERYISLNYPAKKYFLLKKEIQFIYIIIVTLFNILLYIPVEIYNDIIIQSNETACDFINEYSSLIINNIDLINRVIIPSLLMIIFSLLITRTIFTSRNRLISSSSSNNRTFRKDVRFSLIIIILNISYILFSLPVSILVLFSNYWLNPFYIFFTFFYFLSYSINFYLMFSVNSLFRGAFYSIFVCSNNEINNINNRPNIRQTYMRRNNGIVASTANKEKTK